jgi:hypothetical protein
MEMTRLRPRAYFMAADKTQPARPLRRVAQFGNQYSVTYERPPSQGRDSDIRRYRHDGPLRLDG